MKLLSEKTLTLLLLISILLTNLLTLNYLIESKRQRGVSFRERQQIICILKIVPTDRVAHPEKVKECENR